MPVLSGLQVTLARRQRRAGRHRSRAHDPRARPGRRRRRGQRGRSSARLLGDTLQKLDGGHGVASRSATTRRRSSRGRFTSTLRTLAATEFPRLPEPERRRGVKVDAAPVRPRRLRQVVPAASRDDARPILTGVLIAATAEGLRLVATDSYRLAVRDLEGVTLLPEGQKVLVAAKGLGEVQRLLPSRRRRSRSFLGERDVMFRVGDDRGHDAPDRGRVPELPAADPERVPQQADRVERDALQSRGRTACASSAAATATARRSGSAMSAEGLELSAIAQDVGEAHEAVEAKYEGTDLTVAFNSKFLLDGIDAAGVRRGGARVDRPAEAGGAPTPATRRLPLPADARADRLSADDVPRGRRRVAPGSALAGDFRCYERGDARAARPASPWSCGANAQGKTSLLEAVGWARDRARRSGACPTPRWCGPGARRRSCGPRSSTARARSCSRPRSAPPGRNRVQLNRQPARTRPRPARARCASRCSRPTTCSS